jgi:hypothetical protein
MIRKIGRFFLLLGLLLLIVFLASPSKDAFMTRFCLGGSALILIGVFLTRISKPESPQSKRFRLLRKLLPGDNDPDKP